MSLVHVVVRAVGVCTQVIKVSNRTGASGDSEICPRLLDMLQSPRPSDLARKWKIRTNPPPVGKKRSQTGTSAWKHDPKLVTRSHRAYQLSSEHLTTSGGRLFCKACRECLAWKQNVVVSQRSKEYLLEKEARERELAQAIESVMHRLTVRVKLSMKTPMSTE